MWTSPETIDRRRSPLAGGDVMPSVSTAAVIRAFVGFACVDVILRLRGYARLKAKLSRQRHSISNNPSRTVGEVMSAVDRAAMLYPKQAMCLERSAVALWMLRRRGIDAHLVIGCRHTPFYAHAWVEIDGQVANDRPAVAQMYPELERI